MSKHGPSLMLHHSTASNTGVIFVTWLSTIFLLGALIKRQDTRLGTASRPGLVLSRITATRAQKNLGHWVGPAPTPERAGSGGMLISGKDVGRDQKKSEFLLKKKDTKKKKDMHENWNNEERNFRHTRTVSDK